MNLFHKLLLITLFLFNLNASESFEQIIITKTSHKSNLGAIKRKLDSINVKMFVQKVDSYYLVYSPRYNDVAQANKSLQKINYYFPYARLIEKEVKREDVKHEKEKETTTDVTSSSTNENNFFIALGASLNTLSITFSDANGSAAATENGTSYAMEAGYTFNENIFATVGYINSSMSDIQMHNIYASIDYNMHFTNDLSMYVGFIGGLNTLALTGYDSSTSEISYLLGGQVGVMYGLTDYISIYSVYKGLLINQNITLEDGTNIEFSFLHNAQIGVQFKF